MNSISTLTFQWSPWTILLAIALFIATMVFSWIAWQRSGFRKSVLLLEGLRLTVVAIAGLLLNQPEWVEEFRPNEKPVVAILTDASRSMETRDHISRSSAATPPSNSVETPASSNGSPPITRLEAIAPLLDPESWRSLEQRVEIVFEKTTSDGTDLATPLVEIAERHPSLLGVVLASDGDWNEGLPPVQAAGRYRARGIPIFTVAVGSDSRLPDVELQSFDVPTFAIVGKTVRIPFSLFSSLPRDHVATVTLKSSSGDVVTQEIKVAAMSRTSDAIIWKPTEVGDLTMTLSIPVHGGELLEDNNSMSAPMSVREEKLRVLVVESFPRWEYRYLRNALSRDPGVEVSCLLFHPGLGKVGGGNKDYIKEFPTGKDELAPYDVVFLGDVGLEDGQLTLEQCEMLKGLVEQQASGLVFMPGWQGRQLSLQETPLADLYPVILDSAQPNGWGSRTANHFELTELGRRSLLTKLADTEDDNIAVWENLPGFQWYAPVIKAKPGTDVLSVHGDISNEHGRLPLLVTRTFGAGKVLFMGTDGAWRWRKGVEDLYHYRFWGQVVRWMAYRRNMAKGESMRLYYTPEQPQVRQSIALSANVMERNGEPLAKGEVTARIVSPTGTVDTIRFQSSGDAWGAFAGRFTPLEPGKHAVTLFCKETSATLETSLFVQGVPLERIGQPSRPEVLEEIARLTRGRTLQIDKLNEIVQSLATLPEPTPSIRRVQLWSHPVMAGVLIVLLGIFWVGRKVVGFI